MTEAYPLQWPDHKKKSAIREKSRFNTTFAKARDGLLREIDLLGGKLPVISSNIALRRDGLPYANQPEPVDPGVAIFPV